MNQVNIEFRFQKLYVWLHQKFPRFVTITAEWVGHDILGQLSLLTSSQFRGGGQVLKQIIPSSLNFLFFLSLPLGIQQLYQIYLGFMTGLDIHSQFTWSKEMGLNLYLFGLSKISHSAGVLMDFRVTSIPWYVHQSVGSFDALPITFLFN